MSIFSRNVEIQDRAMNKDELKSAITARREIQKEAQAEGNTERANRAGQGIDRALDLYPER